MIKEVMKIFGDTTSSWDDQEVWFDYQERYQQDSGDGTYKWHQCQCL